MRALWAVASLTNELQVRSLLVQARATGPARPPSQNPDSWASENGLSRPVKILRYFLAFCVWLGGMYLLAMINDALFAIFLGSSMIIGGIYILPLTNDGSA